MANKGRKTKGKRLNVFFLNGKLHRRLRIVRPEDKIETWCYPDQRRVVYTYSDVKKNYKPAFTTREVGEMVNRAPRVVERMAREQVFDPAPPMMYTLSSAMNPYGYRWSEEHIMGLHSYLLTVHRGRPRKDGRTTPSSNLPTARELRAMVRQEQVLYVRTEDGEFVPTWRAPDFS